LYAEDEYDVLNLLRNNARDEDIVEFFKKAMWVKHKDGWEAQREPIDKHRDSMTQIGG